MPNAESVCRVCGWDAEEVRWDATGAALFVHCDCCGSESGYQDATPDAALNARTEWLARGAAWSNSIAKPGGWNADEQLRAVPTTYKG